MNGIIQEGYKVLADNGKTYDVVGISMYKTTKSIIDLDWQVFFDAILTIDQMVFIVEFLTNDKVIVKII